MPVAMMHLMKCLSGSHVHHQCARIRQFRVLDLIIATETVSFTSNSWVRKVHKVKGEGKKRIVAVLPPGDDDSPEVLNSVKRGLGLRAWLEGMGHEYIVTAEKDPGTGKG